MTAGQKALLFGDEMVWCLWGLIGEMNVISFGLHVKRPHELLSCQDVNCVLSPLRFPLASFRPQVTGHELAFPTSTEKLHTKGSPCEDGSSHLQTHPLHPSHTSARTEAISLTHQRNHNMTDYDIAL